MTLQQEIDALMKKLRDNKKQHSVTDEKPAERKRTYKVKEWVLVEK